MYLYMCLYTFVPLPFVSGNLNLLDGHEQCSSCKSWLLPLQCFHIFDHSWVFLLVCVLKLAFSAYSKFAAIWFVCRLCFAETSILQACLHTHYRSPMLQCFRDTAGSILWVTSSACCSMYLFNGVKINSVFVFIKHSLTNSTAFWWKHLC